MTIVLTGAAGFLGRAFLRTARQNGAAVRALVRHRPLDAVEHAWAETRTGNLARPETLHGLVHAGDVLVHAAAMVDLNADWSAQQRDTIDATANLLDAALPANPARIVYVSSAAVYGTRCEGVIRAGRTTPRPGHDDRYGRAKLAAERLVQSRCAAARVQWTVIRLGFLYGPENRAMADGLRVLKSRRRLRIVGSGLNRIATLHVNDAAEAVWIAATHPDTADRIIDAANEERVTQSDFIGRHALALGLGPVDRHIPRPLAYLASGVAEVVMAAIGETPAISRSMTRLMSCDQVIDASEIRSLGWSPAHSFAHEMSCS